MSLSPAAIEWSRAPSRQGLSRCISLRNWVIALVVFDALVALLAGGAGVEFPFGSGTDSSAQGIPYSVVPIALPLLWIAALAAGGAYDRRFLVSGADEYRRVFNCGIWLTGVTAFVVFVLHVNLSRQFVAIAFPLLIAATLLERHAARRALHRQLARGDSIYRTVVVGSYRAVRELVEHVERAPWSGFRVVGHYSLEQDKPDTSALVDWVRNIGANTIAVAGGGALRNGALRELSWRLEGTGIQLVVAPAVTDVAGPRIVVRPVQGLPLLIVEDPEFTGARRLLKECLDRIAAGMALIGLMPALLAAGALVKLSSPGPVLYKQERVGLNGRCFVMWKFRTMRVGADQRLPTVAHLNHCDQVLFKICSDPRVTRIGSWLRRHSLDELPQLWNVLRGQMSLVGPRPPLPQEVEQYGDDVRRRLLVKPGMTGLWQVSGRAELPWQETVRLDLFYVDNWSVTLDLMVIWKTLAAVAHGRGAY